MILTPSVAPPQLPRFTPPELLSNSSNSSHAEPSLTRPPPQADPAVQTVQAVGKDATEFFANLHIPAVVLQTPSISNSMAAALAVSLLGHILFLKNQVPFPVLQLARMPGGKSDTRAAKKRDELVAAFDTLSSHLQTSFVALSTAYARRKVLIAPKGNANDVQKTNDNEPDAERRACAHIMFVVGSSAGAARARVILTLDGLQVKVWGEREDAPPPIAKGKAPKSDSEDSGTEGTDGEDGDESSDEENDESSEESDQSEDEDEAEDGSGSETEGSDGESSSGSPPPPSRTPSPSPSESHSPLVRSSAPSPDSLPSPNPLPTPLFGQRMTPLVPLRDSPPPSVPPLRAPSSSPPPAQSHAEEQQSLRAAERLLSRTLLNANAEDGQGMSSELAPTQTHVYLRAPRRFTHPAWIPRQNLVRSLDGALDAFLTDTGAVLAPDTGRKPAKRAGIKTEGVWIGCSGGSTLAVDRADEATRAELLDESEREMTEDEEQDEMIWWEWDGKIVGFSCW